MRFRDIDKVIEEMECLINQYGVKEFQIIDDNFTMDKKRALEFCSRITSKNINTHVSFPNGVRLDRLDDEILLALKEIGAYSITVAVESGSQRVLDHMRKQLTVSLVREKTKLIKKFGFYLNAFFIVGYPAETKEDIRQTIDLALKLPLDLAHFSSFLPLPGTDITDELLRSGELKNINYEELFYSKVPYSPKGITKAELKELQKKAFLLFYLRPRIMFGILRRIKTFHHFRSIFSRMVDYIFRKEGK